MIKIQRVDKILLLLAYVLIGYGMGSTVLAQSLSSGSYRIDESYIGPGGTVNSQSAHYSESSTAGDSGVGSSSSAGYTATLGTNTTNEPRLVVMVNTSSINFGQLSTAVASTATSTFSVLNYTSGGYSVFTVGATPSNGTHNLNGINPTTASQAGTEQFGINLMSNSSPVSLGDDPVQVPSGSFSFGAASTGYNSADNYRYVNGEEIAHSLKSSGETDYTISYIINVANSTPGGSYSGGQALVVVGTY